MNASSKRILRLGLTAGLSLGAIVGLVGCAEQTDDVNGNVAAAVESENGFTSNGFTSNGFAVNGFTTNGFTSNGFTANGFAMNGFTTNGFSTNGFAMNGFSSNGFAINGFTSNGFTSNGFALNGFTMNGLETTGGLSSTSGMMTTPGGREFIKYMVKVAYPSGHSLTMQDNASPPNSYTFDGSLGVAPELEYGSCDLSCQERVSSAMLAHVNNSGLHVGIWLVGPDSGIGWGTSPNYPYMEATYFGNIFAPNPHGNYCAGKNLASGDAKGRLGSPFANSALLNSPYGWGWDGVTGQNVPVYCANSSNVYCTAQNEGYSSCTDGSPQTPYAQGHSWTHPVTVYRNFEATQLYKICNKGQVNMCLGVVGGSSSEGAAIETRTFSNALGQTWQILQVSPGVYKVINRTSGKALDISGGTITVNGQTGTQLVQRSYTNASTQNMPITYITGAPGFASLTFSSNTGSGMRGAGGVWSGALMMNGAPVGGAAADSDKWYFQAIGLATFDPGRYNRLIPQHAQTRSLDVCYASTANGTCVQIYDTWNGDPQKFIVSDAGNGNVKITMKLNTAKCLGPHANGTTANTAIEVQDCNGSYNQAWMTSEQGAGTGIFAYRNAAAPNLCLDVYGAGNYNGAGMILYYCSGAPNQLYKVLAQ